MKKYWIFPNNEFDFTIPYLMLNEIYADYGLIFKDKKLADLFAKEKWYKPQYENVDQFLTDIDKHNIEVIKEFKKTL